MTEALRTHIFEKLLLWQVTSTHFLFECFEGRFLAFLKSSSISLIVSWLLVGCSSWLLVGCSGCRIPQSV